LGRCLCTAEQHLTLAGLQVRGIEIRIALPEARRFSHPSWAISTPLACLPFMTSRVTSAWQRRLHYSACRSGPPDLVFAFDRNIAGLVLQVTDVSRPDSGNTPEGKGNRLLRKAVAGASWQGQMIKCADMLSSNTKDIVAHDLGFARVYVPEKKLLIDELTKARKVSYPIWRRL
jgi:hypothetical protein